MYFRPMHPNALQTPITYLKGVGPGRGSLLGRELGLETYQDLLYLFPNRYIDKSRFYRSSDYWPDHASENSFPAKGEKTCRHLYR